jgi:hypothetical protein
MTGQAKNLILDKIKGTGGQFLVTGARLPFSGDTLPDPLV